MFFFITLIILGAPLGYTAYKKYRESREKEKFSNQIPDTLEALANAMKAGYSFPQALTFVTREAAKPIQIPLQRATEKMQYNFGIKETLSTLKKEANHPDIDLTIDGILMQYSIGGNIIEMLEKMSHLIRDRRKLEKDIKSFTAQGRFSGILISLLCPVSLIMFYIISPEYIGVMFSNPLGQALLLLALVLEIIGFRLIWKITHIQL